MPKVRLDVLLVERGLAPSREKAQALVMAGQVLVGNAPAGKPGRLVARDVPLHVQAGLPFVSRGGLKLAHALDSFGLGAAGLVALDAGAGTGGFTDCLLQRGAARVYALDVGYGQLDYRLRTHPQVVVMERVNAHYPFDLPEAVDLATVDVAFISLLQVLPNIIPWVKPGGSLVALVKPQFEAGRRQVGRGGIVRDPRVHAQVLAKVLLWAIDQPFDYALRVKHRSPHGGQGKCPSTGSPSETSESARRTGQRLRLGGVVPSPILGAEGNREFLVWLRVAPS